MPIGHINIDRLMDIVQRFCPVPVQWYVRALWKSQLRIAARPGRFSIRCPRRFRRASAADDPRATGMRRFGTGR